MLYDTIFEMFREKSPISLMGRAALEDAFSASHLDEIFRENAKDQREGDLPFSQVADVLSLAVLKIRPSVNAAYQDKKQEVALSINSVYNKLSGIEPGVSRAMVRDSAARMAEVQEAMGHKPQPLQSGYRTRILDGKHLSRTDRRLKPLRELNAAPLPGQALAVLDADRQLVCDTIPSEDAHAQERSLVGEILQTVHKGDLWIADRNFCTVSFLKGIASQAAHFIIRRHAQLPLTTVGRKRQVGKNSDATIYEQVGYVQGSDGPLKVRVITVKLRRPTRNGDWEVVLISNLPQRVSARRIAQLYRQRWTIETAFGHIATALHGEIDSLAYPKAALFGFCIALVAYNLLNEIKAAIATAHNGDPAELSTYYLADQISATYEGMMIVLPPSFWHERFGNLSPSEMGDVLLNLAHEIKWTRFQKHQRGPKKPPPNLGSKKNRSHVSTRRVLDEYQETHC